MRKNFCRHLHSSLISMAAGSWASIQTNGQTYGWAEGRLTHRGLYCSYLCHWCWWFLRRRTRSRNWGEDFCSPAIKVKEDKRDVIYKIIPRGVLAHSQSFIKNVLTKVLTKVLKIVTYELMEQYVLDTNAGKQLLKLPQISNELYCWKNEQHLNMD